MEQTKSVQSHFPYEYCPCPACNQVRREIRIAWQKALGIGCLFVAVLLGRK